MSPRCFVIGHPIAHSRSPLIHGEWLRQYRLAGSYERVDVAPADLPAFIRELESARLSATPHRVWFQMELATPFFVASMVMVSAGFTMRHTRFGRTGLMVLLALMLGFGAFFIRNFAQILGQNGDIPVFLAAWSPPAITALLSLGLLLHTEDG